MSVNSVTFAARSFRPRQGASDEHIPQWICEERATPPGPKRTAARRVAPNLAWGFVARRSQPHYGDAPSSRLAPGQIGRNKRHRIYALDHEDLGLRISCKRNAKPMHSRLESCERCRDQNPKSIESNRMRGN